MEAHEWLKDEASFNAQLALATERLDRLAAKRQAFLRDVLDNLSPVLARAERLGDRELVDDLLRIRQEAVRELEETLAPTSAKPAPLAAQEDSGSAADESAPTTEVCRDPAPLPVAKSSGAVVPPEAPSRKPQPKTAAPESPPSAVAPSANKVPKWTPRDRAHTEADLEALRIAVESELPPGEIGLLRLKTLGCKLHHVWAEQQFRADPQEATRSVERQLRDLARSRYPNVYQVWLDPTIHPEHGGHWEMLSWLYSATELAMAAYTWLKSNYNDLSPAEAGVMLEGIGAVQQRLYRHLNKQFPNVHDEQQQALYEGIRTIGAELEHRVDALAPATTDGQLTLLSTRLEADFRGVKQSSEKRLCQTRALSELAALLAEQPFGTREDDDSRLIAACAGCLKAGVPPTRPEFRNALLPWES